MRTTTLAAAGSLMPGLAIPAGLPWPAACILATLGLLATTAPTMLRELHLHQEVMASVEKAGDQNVLDVTQVITLIRGTPTATGPAWSRRRTARRK